MKVYKENECGKAIVWGYGRLPESFRGVFGWAVIFYGRVMREFIGFWI